LRCAAALATAAGEGYAWIHPAATPRDYDLSDTTLRAGGLGSSDEIERGVAVETGDFLNDQSRCFCYRRVPRRTARRQSALSAGRRCPRYLASKQARRDDTRRKIMVGSIMLAKFERGEINEKKFRAILDQALTRADDRALFGLPQR